jgi:hypothetical protein
MRTKHTEYLFGLGAVAVVPLFGRLSVLDQSVFHPLVIYSLAISALVAIGITVAFLIIASVQEPVIVYLLEFGAAAVVSYSFLIMVISRPPLALFVALATLLGAVFVDNLLKENDLEIHKKIAVSLSIPLTLILFTKTVFLSPLLALVVFVVAVAVGYLLWIAEPTGYDLLSFAGSTERKIALTVAVPIVLLLFTNYALLTPAYDDTTMKVGPERSCSSPNGEYYYPQTYTSVEQNTEQIPGNKPLEIAEEEYGIKNPKLVDEKPRRLEFAREIIDVEKRYDPNRYYMIEGGSFDKKHLLIVREDLFASGTRLVQFKSDIC